MFVEIVSPSGRVFSGESQGITAPGVEGSFQVLKNHAPLIAAIEVGPLVVKDNQGHDITFATSGGFVEVANNSVTVLAETAELASEIDVERAKEAEQRAVEALAGSLDEHSKAAMTVALERARNRVRVAVAGVGRRK